MIKPLQLLLLLLATGIVCYWFLFRSYPPARQVPAAVISRNAADLPDSVRVSAGKYYERGALGRFFLGQHNRRVWAAPVSVPVLHINRVKGGLQLVEVGGGMQTLSFTLTDSSGRSYALRSVDKDPVAVLPRFWQKTFVGGFVRDQIAGAHPYGALVVPVLAQAAGIFHATPQLYYVMPNDPAFGAYAAQAGGKLFLLEEKYKNKPSLYPVLGDAVALVNTRELLYNRFRYNTHRIDQERYLKCRLLDFLIGDWDRHAGQWTWVAYSRGPETWYQPIPKDRDQAFCNYRDGLIPWLATRSWAMPKFGHFTPQLDNPYGLTVNAAFLDERALVNLSASRFEKIARQLQQALTDNVIDSAVQQLPASIRKMAGADLADRLKSRRAQLPAAAQYFYLLLAKCITIAGSDEAELFDVRRLNNDQTRVRVFRLKNNGKGNKLVYRRVFLRRQTEQITLHGLDGNDIITISGKVDQGIPINVYGGPGADKITDSSSVAGPQHMTRIFDTSRGNTLYLGPEAANKTTRDVRVHAYNRDGF